MAINQIFNAKLQDVSDTGKVNFGDVIHIRPNFNFKGLGASAPVGDFICNINAAENQSIDPDVVDQF